MWQWPEQRLFSAGRVYHLQTLNAPLACTNCFVVVTIFSLITMLSKCPAQEPAAQGQPLIPAPVSASLIF